MESQTFDYADELLDFIDQLLYAGAQQFSVEWHKGSEQWAVLYPPGVMQYDEAEEN